MVAVPSPRLVSKPVVAPIMRMDDEEFQVPPIESSLKVTDCPAHKASGPEIGAGILRTEMVLKTGHPAPIE